MKILTLAVVSDLSETALREALDMIRAAEGVNPWCRILISVRDQFDCERLMKTLARGSQGDPLTWLAQSKCVDVHYHWPFDGRWMLIGVDHAVYSPGAG